MSDTTINSIGPIPEAESEAPPEIKALRFMIAHSLNFTAFDWTLDEETGHYHCSGHWGVWSDPPLNVVTNEITPPTHVVIREWLAMELVF